MHLHRSSLLSISLGWAVTIAIVFAVPLISIDAPDRSQFFWHRVLWSAFLATLVWSSVIVFIMRATNTGLDEKRTGGIFPAVGLVVMAYVVASFISMILFMLFSNGGSPSKTHLVIQVCLAGTAGVLYALLSLARSAASIDAPHQPPGILNPPALATHIEEQEQRFKDIGIEGAPIATELKKLRESINYSLSRVGGIASSGSYHTYSTKVVDLCKCLSSSVSVTAESMGERIDTIRILRREAKSIADGLKR